MWEQYFWCPCNVARRTTNRTYSEMWILYHIMQQPTLSCTNNSSRGKFPIRGLDKLLYILFTALYRGPLPWQACVKGMYKPTAGNYPIFPPYKWNYDVAVVMYHHLLIQKGHLRNAVPQNNFWLHQHLPKYRFVTPPTISSKDFIVAIYFTYSFLKCVRVSK